MKNNFSKILLIAVISILIFPQVSFAAWWNPFSWFKRTAPIVQPLPQKNEALQKQQAEKGTKPVPTQKVNDVKSTQKISSPTPSTQASARKLTNKEIIAKVKPAVVYIATENGSGSGMIIEAGGFILTNAHVVSGSQIAKVTISTGEVIDSTVVGRDENIDLAILKMAGVNFSKVEFGNSDQVEQGDDVFTLGYPFGIKGDVSFKEGTISRRISDESGTYLETSAEIHPGNSGGPLVNIKGQVVGINTASLGNNIRGVSVGETIKFAIPVNVAKDLIPLLKSGRQVIAPKTGTPSAGDPFEDSGLKVAKCQAEKQASYNSSLQIFNQKIQQELEVTKMQIIQRRNARINEINATADQNRDSCLNASMMPADITACIQDNSNQAMQLMNLTSRASDEEWAQAKRNSETAKQTFTRQITPTLDQQYLTCLNK